MSVALSPPKYALIFTADELPGASTSFDIVIESSWPRDKMADQLSLFWYLLSVLN